MDPQSIERIRTATFNLARRGYDKREVDRFLAKLADWLETGAGDDPRAAAVRTELERIGEQTGKILIEAHQVAEGLRDEAERHAQHVRSEADAYAERMRIEADEYAQELRGDADGYVKRIRNDAAAEAASRQEQVEKEAEDALAEAAGRRRQLEIEIGELETKRETVIEDIQRLSSSLAGTATEFRPPPSEPPSDEYDAEESEESDEYEDEDLEDVADEELDEDELEELDEDEDLEEASGDGVRGETVDLDVEDVAEEQSSNGDAGDALSREES